jgi:L-ribulokinase
MVMQIYADVMGRPIQISASSQTCALGAAIAGAVAAGAYPSFADAAARLTHLQPTVFAPIAQNQARYDRLYALYKRVHDAFGVRGASGDLYDVMKELLALRDEARHV